MTSFIISSHSNRPIAPSWSAQDMESPGTPCANCPFCRIALGLAPAHVVYETPRVVALLDILPLRPGHVLVIPKRHVRRLSDVPPEDAAALGEAVTRVARALTEALGNTALNVVCNQEYAQAVPHVHYHIVPAPTLDTSSKISPVAANAGRGGRELSRKEMHWREFEAREELDDDEAKVLVEKIKARL